MFRNLFAVPGLAVVLFGANAAYAQGSGQPLMCVSNAGVPPVVRAEGYTELVGDIVISCTGGNPGAPYFANFQIFVNTNITSRLISSTQSEALLMIDDPGVPRATGRPAGFCVAAPGSNSAPTTDPACIAQAGDTFQSGFNTVFYAARAQDGGGARDNSLVWTDIPIVPPGANRTRTFRITNVRVNAAGLGASETLIPTQIVSFVAVSPIGTLPIDNPQQTVGYVMKSLLFDVRNTSNTDAISVGTDQCLSEAANRDFFTDPSRSGNLPARGIFRFREAFQTAFKPQIETSQNGADAGSVYNSESGFVRLNGTGVAGLADSGTRLAVRFANVPANLRIFVSTTDLGSGEGSSSLLTVARAVLVSTEANGVSSSDAVAIRTPVHPVSRGNLTGTGSSFTPQLVEVPIVNGSGVAVWEVVRSHAGLSEEFLFAFGLGYTHQPGAAQVGIGTATAAGGYAPFYGTGSNADRMSTLLPVSRFVSPTETLNMVRIQACPNTLSWVTPPPSSALSGTTFNVAAQSVSGAVTYTAGPASVCTLSGSTVTAVSPGTCTVKAALAGDPSSALQVPVDVISVPCTYSLSSSSLQSGGGSSTGSFTVTTGTGCLWTARSTAYWITLTSASNGNGTGFVTYSVAANAGATPRTGVIEVARQFFTITQAGACTYSLSSSSQQSVAGPSTGSFAVNASTGCPWTVVSNADWITVTSASTGSGNGSVTFSVAPNPGSTPRTGSITAAGQTFTVTQAGLPCTYSLTSSSVQITGRPSTGSFGVMTNPGCQWSPVSNTSWISVTGWVGSGTGSVTFSVAANPEIIRRTGSITVAGQTFTITQDLLTLTVSEGWNIRFDAVAGSTTAMTGAQSTRVIFTGLAGTSATWTASSNQPWLSVTPSSGTGNGILSLALVPGSVPGAGSYTATVTVAAAGVVGSPTTFTVPLTVTAAAATQPPFGFIDTPENNATVAGAVGVTGWALDDIEVASVEVWRKSVPGEPHLNGQVFVGNGIFLDGARPDIANKNPLLPFNTRAGWGMQILTNMLPNATGTGLRGNGQHQLFVYAVDKEDKRTLLGSRVINVNNATAVKPFGTLDTPASGGTAEGAQYTVWGWALTPQPAAIPTDGSTMWVFVDGVSVAHPVYNVYRPDVSALFPGLQNSSAPVGYYYLDTTKLANGMHSIAWSVTDNLGRIEGIGSRLFFVQNAGAAAASDAKPVKSMRSAEREGIWFRTGYDPNAPLQKLEGSEIAVEQGGRIELHVAGAASVDFNGSAVLPVGSTLEDGVFYWQLDAAYIASYELRFRDANGSETGIVNVRTTRTAVQ